MAKIIAKEDGNLNWWLRCFNTSHKSWSIANNFVKRLKNNSTFIHPLENGANSSSFLYSKGEDKIFISINFSNTEGLIIFSKDLGRFLKLTPIVRPYNNEFYCLDNVEMEELIIKVDEYVKIINDRNISYISSRTS